MAKGRRKKKRTQRDEQPDPAKKGVPKSFVWAAGSKRSLVRELCGDLRCLMQPHTAAKLKVSHRNVLKDFVHVAGPLGVTHFVVLTATDKASYLKLCKSPRGPTAVLKILEYSHMRDVLAAQRHPRRPDAAFLHPPLVVLQGFTGEQHMKLTAVLFQNMFPAINVTKAKLSECQRVVLLVHNKAKETISLRHFNVSVAPAGLTKGVKALVSGKAPPDLSGFTDVADFVERAGYASESEGEDAAAGRVEVGQAVGRNNPANRTSRIRLHEMGPRLELQLLKVQEGLAEGRVLYHRFEQRSAADAAEQQIAVDESARLRAERRRQQEENVRAKAREKARIAAAQQAEQEKKLAKRQRDEVRAAPSGKLPKRAKGQKKQWWEDDGSEEVAEDDNDVAHYEREVGEKPDEHFGGPSVSAAKPEGAAKHAGKPWGRQGAFVAKGRAGVKKPAQGKAGASKIARGKSDRTKPKRAAAG